MVVEVVVVVLLVVMVVWVGHLGVYPGTSLFA